MRNYKRYCANDSCSAISADRVDLIAVLAEWLIFQALKEALHTGKMLDTVLRQAVSHQRGIIMTTVQITLPDQLAQDAQRAGLLSQSSIEKLLREKLQAQRRDEFFAASERMAQVTEPTTMSPEEVAEEIRAMREERRAKASD